MSVDRDRGDPVDRERPRRHRPPEPRGVRQHPPADARVDVAADARARPRAPPSSVTGSTTPCAYDGARADDQHRRRSSIGRGRRGDVGAEVGADRHHHAPRRRSSARPCGTPRARSTAAPSAGVDVRGAASRARLHRQQHRLGAARGHRPDRRVRRVEQVAARSRPGRSPSQQAGERRRVEPVGAGVRRHRLAADPVDVGQPGVVDVGQRAAAVHRQVARPAAPAAGPARRRSCSDLLLPAATSAASSGTATSRPEAEQHQAAGSTEKPSVIAVSAESGWATSPVVDDW